MMVYGYLVDDGVCVGRSVISHAPTAIYELKLTIRKEGAGSFLNLGILFAPPAHEICRFHEHKFALRVHPESSNHGIVYIAHLYRGMSQQHVRSTSLILILIRLGFDQLCVVFITHINPYFGDQSPKYEISPVKLKKIKNSTIYSVDICLMF